MKSFTAREVIKQLNKDGWHEVKAKATSHKQFYHPSKPGKVTVPVHPGDLPPKTLKNIEKQSGLKFK